MGPVVISKAMLNGYSDFLKRYFPGKVQKLSVDGGFGCPNRDGTIGTGGCTYCNNLTFVPSYCSVHDSIQQQLELGKQFFARKYPEMQYLAYFQAHTNTYAPLSELMAKYEEALSVDGIVGLVIGTRPDCLPEELLQELSYLSKRTFVMVEIGIESLNDEQLKRLNRGHTFAQTCDALHRLADYGLLTAGHVILGLPGDTRDSILQQPAILSALPLQILKLHQLQIVKGSRMAEDYKTHPNRFPMLFDTPEEYADVVCEYLRRLRPDMVVERFTSQSPSHMLIAPRWGLKNHEFADILEKHMKQTGAYQGELYEDCSGFSVFQNLE